VRGKDEWGGKPADYPLQCKLRTIRDDRSGTAVSLTLLLIVKGNRIEQYSLIWTKKWAFLFIFLTDLSKYRT
jgi:hypothetical protein